MGNFTKSDLLEYINTISNHLDYINERYFNDFSGELQYDFGLLEALVYSFYFDVSHA